MHSESIRNWLFRHHVDKGAKPGPMIEERTRLKELERKNKEPRRANDILKAAASFVGT